MEDIEVVIRIPKETYDYVKKQVAEGIDNPLKVYIANGTPLPKGHGDLIDRDMLPTDYITDDDITDASAIIKADKEVENEKM